MVGPQAEALAARKVGPGWASVEAPYAYSSLPLDGDRETCLRPPGSEPIQMKFKISFLEFI